MAYAIMVVTHDRDWQRSRNQCLLVPKHAKFLCFISVRGPIVGIGESEKA